MFARCCGLGSPRSVACGAVPGQQIGLECSDSAGTVVEADRMATSVTDPAFAAIAAVDEQTARARAVDTKPGRIEHVAYKLGRARQAGEGGFGGHFQRFAGPLIDNMHGGPPCG